MALQLLSLTHRFGKKLALDAVTLQVRDGECYGFIGHNGAGKTTTLRMALGLLRPDRGEIYVDGLDARKSPREARARMGGLIEVPGFYDAASGEANLSILARLQGMDRSSTRSEVRRVLDWVGLAGVRERPVRGYSQGMRQRLGIGQALLGRPRYVLLDEPSNGLDPEGIAEVRDLVRTLQTEEGLTFLISSHQLHELSTLSDRVGLLRNGRLLLESPVEELLADGRTSYRVRTDDDARARDALVSIELSAERDRRGGLLVNLGTVPPGEMARRLVEAGLNIELLAPEENRLEDIYLRLAREDGGRSSEAPADLDPAPEPATSRRLAPSRPVFRMLRHEVAALRRGATGLLLLLPGLVGALAVYRRWSQTRADASRLQDEELFSITDVTAFEGVAVGLVAGIPVAVLILTALATQSVARDASRRTLRNIVMRSIGRWQVGAGKALAVLGAVVLSYLSLVVLVLGASAMLFDFVGVTELLPNGERFPLLPADELWPELRKAILLPAVALIAPVAVGFFFGSIARSATAALGLGLGAIALVDGGRVFARGWGVEPWLFSAHLPSPLGDTSVVKSFEVFAQGASNVTPPPVLLALAAPALWAIVAFGLAVLVVRRKAVP